MAQHQLPVGHQPIALNPNSLNGLPMELILSISDLLQPNDILCLSLCNHRLFMALHHNKTTFPQPTGSDKLALLHQIERDLPHHFLCYCCIVLHRFDGPEEFGLRGMRVMSRCRLPCVVDYLWQENELQMQIYHFALHTDYCLSFLHLQLAMRRFYHGPRCGITTELLSHVEIKEYPNLTTLYSIEAQVCTEPVGLYLRTQDIMLVKDQRVNLFEQSITSILPSHNFTICPHICSPDVESLVEPLLLAHIEGISFSQLDGTCATCNTDCHFEIREHCGYVALIVTRWINLGPGLNPDYPLWRIHSNEPWHIGGPDLEPDMAWSPRISYEGASGDWSREALLLRNLSYFDNERYKSLMKIGPWSTWVLLSPKGRVEGLECT